jgi:hypothetical protein
VAYNSGPEAECSVSSEFPTVLRVSYAVAAGTKVVLASQESVGVDVGSCALSPMLSSAVSSMSEGMRNSPLMAESVAERLFKSSRGFLLGL